MLFLLMCTCGACGARCGGIDHTDRVHAGKAAKSSCLQTERAPRQGRQHVQPLYNRNCTRKYELARAPPFPSSACEPASCCITYLLRELLRCHQSFELVTAPCTADAPGGLGGRRTLASRPLSAPACATDDFRPAHAPFGRAARCARAHAPRVATGPAAQPQTARRQPRRAAPRSPPRTLSRATHCTVLWRFWREGWIFNKPLPMAK